MALSRCPQQALCTLEYFTPKSLRFNSTAEWALTKLKAQQADRDGSRLWKQLFEPPESKEFYEARLAEMGTPNWSKMKRDKEKIQDGEQLWLCLQCGQEAPNAKAGIKAHKRKCPAKLEAKANAKAKAKMAKSKGKTKCRSQSTRRPCAHRIFPWQATCRRLLVQRPPIQSGQDRRRSRAERSCRPATGATLLRTTGSSAVWNPCPQQCSWLPLRRGRGHDACSRNLLV